MNSNLRFCRLCIAAKRRLMVEKIFRTKLLQVSIFVLPIFI